MKQASKLQVPQRGSILSIVILKRSEGSRGTLDAVEVMRVFREKA